MIKETRIPRDLALKGRKGFISIYCIYSSICISWLNLTFIITSKRANFSARDSFRRNRNISFIHSSASKIHK